jgi:hypothetical protein
MFSDNDINFDLQLEQFGVNTTELRQPVNRVFHAWVEDWEEEDQKVNDCVTEARILRKYKNLVFHDPDTGGTFCIWEKNMELGVDEVTDGCSLVHVPMKMWMMSHLHLKLRVN